ncbi:hypothetical protein QCA50_017502 [Cerrena zonata]|uniref:Uncharacterized protein n=1 Tax=Cerrena zonata TaxID=2478898 RepID=A0AAW0FD26_9APHY
MGGVILEALRPSPDGSVPLAKLKQLDLILPYGKNLSEYFNKEEFCQCLERRKEHGCKLRSLSTRGTSKDRKIFDLKDLE